MKNSPDKQFIKREIMCSNSAGMHRIVFSDWGDNNKNTIICIHGLTGNGSDFDFIAPELVKQGYRVIAIDLAGRGRSDFLPNPIDYNYEQYYQDIMAVLDNLNINKPANINWLGVSLGGLLGIRIAGMKNSPIKRLVINDVGPEVPKYALKFIYRVIKKTYKFKNLDAFEQRLRETRGLTWGHVTDEQWKHMAENNYRKLPRGKITYAYDTKISQLFKKQPIGDLDLWQFWNNITCPALVLCGGKSKLLTKDILEKMKDSAISFQMDSHIFEDCGHVPSLMEDSQINVVKDWLEQAKL